MEIHKLPSSQFQWERMQEKSELLEAQAADLTAQLQASQERTSVLQRQLNSQGTVAPLQGGDDESLTVTELHAKCQVRTIPLIRTQKQHTPPVTHPSCTHLDTPCRA